MPLQSGGGISKSKVRNVPPPPMPDWPFLAPLVPPADLTFDELLEGQILVVRNFFTSTLCKQYVSFLSSLPLETTSAKPKDEDLTFRSFLWIWNFSTLWSYGSYYILCSHLLRLLFINTYLIRRNNLTSLTCKSQWSHPIQWPCPRRTTMELNGFEGSCERRC